MRYLHYSLLCIPILCTFLAVMGHGFFFRAAVSLSCAAILFFLPDKTLGNTIWWIIAALLVSVSGDWFMSHTQEAPVRFLYGVSLFFIAHLGLLIFCLKNGSVNPWVLAVILAGFLVLFFTRLSPALDHKILYFAILMYLLVSCVSLAAALGLKLPAMTKWCYVAGIALFVFSDTVIGLSNFAGYKDIGFLILPTYFASHVVITLALMAKRVTR